MDRSAAEATTEDAAATEVSSAMAANALRPDDTDPQSPPGLADLSGIVEALRRRHQLDAETDAELETEAARWARILALVELLTPDERIAPGYFRNPDWTVKDLVAHLGWWHEQARSELLKIATRTYDAQAFDVDRRNAELLEAHRDDPWSQVLSHANAARAWMLEAWIGLRDRSPAATQWVRKAGAEHYGEHLERLHAWTVELIELRARPLVDERQP